MIEQNHPAGLHQTITHVLALGARLENEGQYNIAKLARAAADSLNRQAAYQLSLPTDKEGLKHELALAIGRLTDFGMETELLNALGRGLAAMKEDRLPMIQETPHPYVCRTCGWVSVGEPPDKCPTCGAWPATFQCFLPIYWLEALDPYQAMDALRQNLSAVERLLAGMGEDRLTQAPEEGGWAIRNVVSHLRDAEGLLNFRLELMLEQENPRLESKAVFEWATQEAERPSSTFEIFECYRTSRQATLARLQGISLADWWRTGQHEEFGPLTIRQQVSYFASHELIHMPQIEALR
jgi:hypothetical protein